MATVVPILSVVIGRECLHTNKGCDRLVDSVSGHCVHTVTVPGGGSARIETSEFIRMAYGVKLQCWRGRCDICTQRTTNWHTGDVVCDSCLRVFGEIHGRPEPIPCTQCDNPRALWAEYSCIGNRPYAYDRVMCADCMLDHTHTRDHEKVSRIIQDIQATLASTGYRDVLRSLRAAVDESPGPGAGVDVPRPT